MKKFLKNYKLLIFTGDNMKKAFYKEVEKEVIKEQTFYHLQQGNIDSNDALKEIVKIVLKVVKNQK